MFRLVALFVFICFSFQFTVAQTNQWQQQVNYRIEVSLNDTAHTLTGFAQIAYYNNSPNELPFLYFHLWPNAFKNQSTAFAKQQLENGSARFYNSKSAERGYIDNLAFEANGKALTWEYDKKHPDIAKITLHKPLKSGEQLVITTPFTVKIPESFSRLGHVGQSYQITQWYPKPAVYDAKGWHAMPYLDQGEFYSEFGSFEVSLTLPQNYVVGATGELQNPDEVAWLNEKVTQTEALIQSGKFDEKDLAFPPSSPQLKTITFKQDSIHDFAWFADKRFHVLRDTIQLPRSARKVTNWAMFTNQEAELWKKGAKYVADAVYFYSDKLGLYPYNHCTAVQSALSAGAGMEYPMITVIGQSGSAKSLEQVIVHEVGHNWFYGILATNERAFPWMDEGLNSYYELRYFKEKYPDDKLLGKMANSGIARTFDVAHLKPVALQYYLYLFNARKNADQAITLPSEDYTSLNYGGIVYGKTALVFAYLETWLGTVNFDQIMQEYYRRYSFKHPYPDDLRQTFTTKTPKNLDWFFDELLPTTKKTDYKITRLKKGAQTIGNDTFDKITLKQKGKTGIRAPFTLTAFNKTGEPVKTVWYDGFLGAMEVNFPAGNYAKITIDAPQNLPELYRHNNTLYPNKLLKRTEPFRLQPIAGLENPNRTQLFFAPAIGYNVYDKTMLGIAFYNSLLPARPVQFTLLPMYAIGSNSFSGAAELSLNKYPNKGFKHIELNLAASTFGNGIFGIYSKDTSLTNRTISEEVYKFYRISPTLTFHLNKKTPRHPIERRLVLRHVSVLRTQTECPPNTNCSRKPDNFYLNELAFICRNNKRINPMGWSVTMQQGNNFALAQAEVKYLLSYGKSAGSGLNARFYGAAFLQNNTLSGTNPVLLPLTMRGGYDYALDQIFVGRNETQGMWSRQVGMGGAGFKVPLNIGYTDAYMLALNLKASIPNLKLPIKIYGDIAVPYTDKADAGLWSGKTFFDSGIAFTLVPDVFEVYWSLLSSQNLQDVYEVNGFKWYERFSFLINFKSLNPVKGIRNASSLNF
ncbi:MAG TPA: M1 family metallopeptidase [Chitinophagales bacterium]|nr:M1 family metallopeptidase [Chitinophagales bacterium]